MNRANPAPLRAPRPRLPHLRLAAFGLLLLCSIPGLRSAAEVARDFDIPAGQARDTLKRFAAQAQVEIVFPSENTLGVATNAVRGRLSPAEAITALLAGTNLTATREPKTGAYSVRPRASNPNAPGAAQDNASRRPNLPIVANPRSEAPTPDIVELSPFTVSTSHDTGYAAQETLAGTRMRSSLKDVASSMSIITPEFIQDLGVSSPEQALLYTPSVDTYQGDSADPAPSSLRSGNGQPYSIRGFTGNSQSASTDFFTTFPRMDMYNSERLTLQRGPNALLFGVGGPAGVAVMSTKRAQLQRNATEVSLRTDRWSSNRVTFDHNQVVSQGKLAVRLNALEDWKREFRIFEGYRQHRITGGLTWRPFNNTTVVLNHESYSGNMNYATLSWFFDGGVMQWRAKGSPTVEFPSEGLAWAASGHPARSFDPSSALSQPTAARVTYINGLPIANILINDRLQGKLQNTNAFGGIQAQSYQVQDPQSVFGISRTANFYSGTWDTPSDRLHGHWTQLFVEQRLLPNLYLELAANLAAHKRSYAVDTFYVLRVDVNRYLADGTLNPGYLVPYAESPVTTRVQEQLAEEYRGTLSYERDLGQIHRWLGKHSFGLLGQRTRSASQTDVLRIVNLATAGQAPFATDPVSSALIGVAYFPAGRIAYPLPSAFEIEKQFPVLNSGRVLQGATVADRGPVQLAMRPGSPPSKSKSTDVAASLGWQGRWFGDQIVTTFGYRTDNLKNYVATPLQNVIDPAVPAGITNPASRFWQYANQVEQSTEPTLAARGIGRTYGVVWHARPWLSLIYNYSNNLRPPGSASLNFQGKSLPSASGDTTDCGVRLYLLGGRVSVGANYFASTSANEAFSIQSLNAYAVNILRLLRTNYKYQGDSHFTGMAGEGGYQLESIPTSDTRTYTAKGYEFSVICNLNGNWRVSVSGSINDNKLTEQYSSFKNYLFTDNQPFQGLAIWRQYVTELRKVAGGTRSSAFDLDPFSTAARNQATADASVIELNANSAEKFYNDKQALLNSTNNRNGQYALNGVATYTFAKTGLLKDWSVGGNFRWRSAAIIGYDRMLDQAGLHTGNVIASSPIRGTDYFEVGTMLSYQRRVWGKVNLRVQLNVENPLDWSKPRLVYADYDTNGLLGAKDRLQPLRWELRRPRNFVLTATFK